MNTSYNEMKSFETNVQVHDSEDNLYDHIATLEVNDTNIDAETTTIEEQILLLEMAPRFGLNLSPDNLRLKEKTLYARMERVLCGSNFFSTRTIQRYDCPKKGIVTIRKLGDFGYLMWEYASVYAMSRLSHLQPFIPRCIKTDLDTVFESLSIPSLEYIAYCAFDPEHIINRPENWKNKKDSILLPFFSQSPITILPFLEDIRKEFIFKQHIRDRNQDIIEIAASLTDKTSIIYVGVHISRSNHKSYEKNKQPDEEVDFLGFFNKAMSYYENKYEFVMFILTSDDPAWCTTTFELRENVYVASTKTRTPEEDMALMASCNHSIFDFGNYGMWGALLAGGEVIYYKNKVLMGAFEELLSNWHHIDALENKLVNEVIL